MMMKSVRWMRMKMKMKGAGAAGRSHEGGFAPASEAKTAADKSIAMTKKGSG